MLKVGAYYYPIKDNLNLIFQKHMKRELPGTGRAPCFVQSALVGLSPVQRRRSGTLLASTMPSRPSQKSKTSNTSLTSFKSLIFNIFPYHQLLPSRGLPKNHELNTKSARPTILSLFSKVVASLQRPLNGCGTNAVHGLLS